MKNVGPTRVELGTRTIFNLLGPLSNPANVKRQLVGVFSRQWIEPLAQVLKNLGSDSVWVVHGSDGLDEITTSGPTYVAALRKGKNPHLRDRARRYRDQDDEAGNVCAARDAEHNAVGAKGRARQQGRRLSRCRDDERGRGVGGRRAAQGL